MTILEKKDLSNDMIVRQLTCLAGRDNTEFFDLTIKGFCLRVGKGGKKVWQFKYTKPGTKDQVRRPLGAYPGISCAVARAVAQGLRAQVDNAIDPVSAEREATATAEQEAGERQTLNQLYADWVKLKLETRQDFRTKERVKKYLASVLAVVGDVRCRDFKKTHYNKVMDPILLRSGYTANRTYTYFRILLDFAVQRDQMDANPLTSLPRPFEGEKVGERDLSAKECVILWNNAALLNHDKRRRNRERHVAPIVKLLLLTGQRLNEIRNIRLSWIDWEEKTITFPAWVTKNKRVHILPMSDLTIEIIRGAMKFANGDVLFSNTTESQPILACRVTNPVASNRAAFEELGVAKWSCHDLRRTFTTLATANHPADEFYIEHVTNHASETRRGVGRKHYNKYKYLNEKRDVLNKWATFLQGLIGPQGGNKVVPMRKAA